MASEQNSCEVFIRERSHMTVSRVLWQEFVSKLGWRMFDFGMYKRMTYCFWTVGWPENWLLGRLMDGLVDMDGLWPWRFEVYVFDKLAHGIVSELDVPTAPPLSQQSSLYRPAWLEFHIAVLGELLIVGEKQSLTVLGMRIAGVDWEMDRTSFRVLRVFFQEVFTAERSDLIIVS
jgi:hypothetical protein